MALYEPDVVVVGAGPAGIAAAIQLRRYGLSAVLLEKERVGGLLWNANWVENYPGFPGGISGPQLVGRLENQMERIGTEVVYDEVRSLKLIRNAPVVEASRNSYRPRAAVVASGTKPRSHPLEVPASLCKRVHSEVRALLHIRGRHVVIIGGGDAAFDYALNLSRRNRVTILNRGRATSCLPLLWERAQACSSISYRGGVTLVQVAACDDGRDGLALRCESRQGKSRLVSDYLIFAIGRDPQLDFLSERIQVGQHRQPGEGRLWFAGDVKNGQLRQTAIAVGDGVKAAMQIYETLRQR